MIVFDCSRLYPFEYNGLQPHTSFLLIFSHILRVEGNTVVYLTVTHILRVEGNTVVYLTVTQNTRERESDYSYEQPDSRLVSLCVALCSICWSKAGKYLPKPFTRS